jgi:NADH-quinone oxidoreductase subunit G
MSVLEILKSATLGGWDFLYTAGADPAVKYPSKLWKDVRRNLGFLVVQDLFLTETAQDADVVLPALSAFEKKGHIHNLEGRRQDLNPGKEKPEGVRSDGEIFRSLLEKLNISSSIDHEFTLVLQKDRFTLPTPTKGQKSPSLRKERGKDNALLATFAPSLFDQGARMERNPHLSGLVKEPKVRVHPGEAEAKGLEDGKKVRLHMNGEEIAAKVQFDRRVAPGTVVLPLGFKKIPVNELGGDLLCGDRIELGEY